MSQPRRTEQQKPVIPDKLYFRIGEVARLLGVETHTLRFWETEFPQIRVGKGGTGQRLYRRRDVEALLEIKHLLYEQGFTIPGARQHLQTRARHRHPEPERGEATAPDAAGAREQGLARIRSGLRSLSEQLAAAPGAVQAVRNGRAPAAHRSTGLHLAGRPATGRNGASGTAPAKPPAEVPRLRQLFDGLDDA